jgi:3-oxoacyl-[acyl-carrier-protein] synthase II
MRRAGVDGGKIDCLFAVGSAVPAEDISEARAIRLALGREAETVPVTAPKSAFGHLFGAATPVDVVMALLALHHHVIPPTLHLDRPARECALNNVAQHPRAADRLDVIAVNARGIGGANACLILKRWSPDVEGGRRSCA